MIALQTVLVPTDFSDCSQAALPWALELARSQRAEIVLAHACSGHEDLEAARARLEQVAAGLAPLPVRAVLGRQDPVEFLVELARKTERALMLMGTHGRRGMSRKLLGSTAEGVMARAACPVLTFRHAEGVSIPDSPLEVSRILMPTDLSADSMKAYDYAAEFGKAFGAEVILLHVVEHEEHPVRRRAAADLVAQVARRYPEVRSRVLLEDGPSVDRILDVAADWDVGLIVQATRGPRVIAGVTMGSVAGAVMRRAPCPVLTVKNPEHEFLLPGSSLAETGAG